VPPATETEIRTRLREFLQSSFLYMRPGFVLHDGDSLMQKGVVDSMGVVEVLSFLQESFGVAVDDEELTEQNLGSVSAIVRFVASKQKP
jgi:acyl carrier protein